MLNKDYILPLLGGRLGNNLFMIAHAYAKGIEYNKQVVIFQPHVQYHGNDYSKNIFRKLEFTEELIDSKNFNHVIPSDDQPTLYFGYYQSESYFEKYSENIKSLFGPPLDFITRVKSELPFLFDRKVTVINVRKGDYLHSPNYHPTFSVEYINDVVKHIPNTDIYLIASDDITWCKENIHFDNQYFLEGWAPEEQLWILSMCHNFIIANSSFSWWAAYLSRHTEKIVLAPETWFGPEYLHKWDNVYCKGWTIIPSYFKNGLIFPK